MRNKAQQSEQQGNDEKVVDLAKYLRATAEKVLHTCGVHHMCLALGVQRPALHATLMGSPRMLTFAMLHLPCYVKLTSME